jgi:cyclopropane-fatty-acyl-phospholipid synthase
MSTASIHEIKLAEKNGKRWLDTVARATVHKILKNLKIGRMVIEEDGEIYTFGQDPSETDLIVNATVYNPAVYTDVLFNGTIGSGESYMLGYWTTPDLLKVIRLFVLNMAVIDKMDKRFSIVGSVSSLAYRLLKRNTKNGSRRNIGAHYDLGNNFFDLFLDPQMMYSSAVYPTWQSTLDEAAEHKLKAVCEKLQLSERDHLLEIGTGWGGMAVYAAKNYGCKVTTTTISRQQYEHAKQWIVREGLQDQVELLLKDYRDLDGKYDKLVSIEMIEAVGHRYYANYFKKCSSLLRENGLMLIQAITIPDQRYQQAKKAVDFIQKYIFPGGCLPSHEVIVKNVSRQTDLQITHMEDITAHYARTLADWRQRFTARLDEVKAQGFNNTFIKMWEFYLCYCEGGFRERVIGTAQFVFAKPEARFV